MQDNFFSPYWYRVAELKPKLKDHVSFQRQTFRDENWYVLEDASAGRHFRFNEVSLQFINRLNGQRTVADNWQQLCTELEDQAPGQEEIIQLLAQLHNADVLHSGVAGDAIALFKRGQQYRRKQWQQKIGNFLAIRIPLLDPEKLLNKLSPKLQFLFGWPAVVVWFLVVATAIIQAALHWPELTGNISEQLFTAQNLFLLWLCFPFIKILHEFGHAFVCKLYGGEVHEMGITLLVFTPIPYVNVSSASSFPNRYHRMLVGAAGILVELFIAALAMLFWLLTEPGLFRSICFNLMLIGSISTLVFNGNPLLRFDGYYILSDYLGIPNMASRANRYIAYLSQRYIFSIASANSPVTDSSEKRWLLGYGIAAWLYRFFIMFIISLYFMGNYFYVGVLLAALGLFTLIISPLFKGSHFLFNSPHLNGKRLRAMSITGAAGMTLVTLLCWIPFPWYTVAEGVVWSPESAIVRAGTNGFIRTINTPAGNTVATDELLIICDDPLLQAQLKIIHAKIDELNALHSAYRTFDQIKAKIIAGELAGVNAELQHLQAKQQALQITSPANGLFIIERAEELAGKYVQKGDILAYVIDESKLTVKVALVQNDIALVQQGLEDINIKAKLANALSASYPGKIIRKTPAATTHLPSAVLGSYGGGSLIVDPSDPDGRTSIQGVFLLDVELNATQQQAPLGTRVYVRFHHGEKTLAMQWYHSLSQLFLAEIDA